MKGRVRIAPNNQAAPRPIFLRWLGEAGLEGLTLRAIAAVRSANFVSASASSR
jgi:hypothetical protein